MTNIEQSIATRRERITELQAEIEHLEKARVLLGDLALPAFPPKSTAVKPPPAVEEPVRAEPPPEREKRKRSKPGDPTFGCGCERSTENTNAQGKCRRCKNAGQLAYLERKAAFKKGLSAPPAVDRKLLTRAERDDLDRKESRQHIIDDFKALTTPKAAPFAAAAGKWQKQCVMLDFDSGKRCSLMSPHPMPHSASGRTFTTGLNPADLGGTTRPTREIDEQAMRGTGA